jgi:hypothetical protein
MNIELVYPAYGLDQPATVEDAFEGLKKEPRFGLKHPISGYERAKPGATYLHQRVDYWVLTEGRKIPLRVERKPSRPKRRYLRALIGAGTIPTLMVYARIGLHALTRKVAQCIKLGLDKLRRHHEAREWAKRNPKIVNLPPVPDGPKFNLYKEAVPGLERLECYG